MIRKMINFRVWFIYLMLLPAYALTNTDKTEKITLNATQDTSIIILPKDQMKHQLKNYSAGGKPSLVCSDIGSMFFVAFDTFEIFEELKILNPKQIVSVEISLYCLQPESKTPQQIIARRVLLPWKEGKQKFSSADKNDLTFNSCLHRSLTWNKPPAQAMLKEIDGDHPSDYNGSEDISHRIDALVKIEGSEQRYIWKGNLITSAFQFWLINPDYNYGHLFALRDGSEKVKFASREHPNPKFHPTLTIFYKKN
ncbi:hypothetical protein CMK10_08335 [Candidatus Poribacteria bacterium]|nr:hypothetical protein [Candidatus Poribacteria bacterium]|tara:strand:- start:202 stop:960 length:759 start_codon:yes stop_codon:yes gene_type:complete